MRCKPDEEQRSRGLDRFVSGRNNGLAVSMFRAAIWRAQTRLVVTWRLGRRNCDLTGECVHDDWICGPRILSGHSLTQRTEPWELTERFGV